MHDEDHMAFKFEPNMSTWVMRMQETSCNKMDHLKCLITHANAFENMSTLNA
jgi:hypothetical protein